MFTPLRKGWSFTPRSSEKNGSLQSNPRNTGVTGLDKGKGIAGADIGLATPQGLDRENGVVAEENGAEVGAWKQFREAGMLDEAALRAKDKEALLERIDKLENELYEYQYNMGLLLIEKKEWSSKCNELQRAMTEMEEILKREKAAHLIAISEMDKREDNLKKALSVEKQFVTDLEKALRELRSEHADVKVTADRKLADAQALKEELQYKSLEVCGQIRTADARLAEISRKNSDVERKLQELATRESILQRERLSLNKEKELHAEDLAHQREDLQAWEKSLCEGQERLVESQSLISQREKRAIESDKVLTKKEKDIELLRESIEKANNSLKEREDYINTRLTALAAKEKEVEYQMENIEKRERELLSKEEHANAREKVEIEKIIDNHKTVLASKKREFEMELMEKRKSFDEELTTKLIDVEKREKAIKLIEEKLLKREQTLEKKTEKVSNDMYDHDVKAKALKNWEETMKKREIDLEKKNKRLSEDNEHLLDTRAGIDAERKAIEAERLKLISEQEKLKIMEQEREDLVKLQSKLKTENEECMILKESLAKELEELREERKKFESEWEALDEKRSALSADERGVADEKAGLEKWKRTEELRLKTEQQVARDEMQRELDDLRLKKEAFEANMAHDRSELLEKLRQDRGNMVQELDLRKHELEIDMQRKVQDLENHYQEKETELNEQRMIEMDRIKSLRELAASEMQKLKIEQAGFEREKDEYLMQRKKLKEDQFEIQNDIKMLCSLSRNLKDQRGEFIRARNNFLRQSCSNCGVQAELVFPAILPSDENDAPGDAPLPYGDGYLDNRLKAYQTDISPVANGSQSGASGSQMSWLRACTQKLFNLSPQKGTENCDERDVEKSNILGLRLENELSPYKANEVAKPADLIESAKKTPEETDKAAKTPGTSHNVLGKSINQNEAEDNVSEMVSKRNISALDGHHELGSLSPLAEESVEPQVLKNVKRGGRRRKPRILKRTHSVQAVVKESKALLNETCDNTGADYSLNNDVSQGDSVGTENTTSLSQKRYSEREIDADSESHSESVSVGGHRKRRHIVPETRAAGEKRYNFRRSTIEGTGLAQVALGKSKGGKTRKPSRSLANEQSYDIVDEQERTSKQDPVVPPAATAQENGMSLLMCQRSTVDSIVEAHEPSSQRVVQQVQEEAMPMGDTECGQIVEINGDESASILAGQGEESYNTEDGGDPDGDDDDDESDSEKHNASIGKKLWKFFTS